jgi:hypothetical protein
VDGGTYDHARGSPPAQSPAGTARERAGERGERTNPEEGTENEAQVHGRPVPDRARGDVAHNGFGT